MGSILVGPALKKLWKNGKISSVFWGTENPKLGMDPDLQIFLGEKESNQPFFFFFEGEKPFDMGRAFKPRAAYPVKK